MKTENEAIKAMYEYTACASSTARQLAYFIGCLYAAKYISGNWFVIEWTRTEQMSLVCVLTFWIASLLQVVWQGVGCDILGHQLDADCETEVDEWPPYIEIGGWFFFGLKMAFIIAAAVLYIIGLV